MGKLIKNHWARLIILTAAAYQILASIYAFFWPKLFFDFLTTTIDHAVRPLPILQIINLLLGILGLAWEWPLPLFISARSRESKRMAMGGSSGSGGYYVGRSQPGERANTTRDTTKTGLQAAVTATA